jgi:HEAT repeat protein
MPLVKGTGQPARTPGAGVNPLSALSSDNDDQRWAAARALVTRPDAVTLLSAALLTEKSPRVRAAMLTSLGQIGDGKAIAAIVRLLRSDDAQERTAALDVLRSKGTAVSSVDLLQDPDIDVRILSCEIVREFSGPQATGLLCAILADDPEPNVCGAALDVLVEMGNADALPFIETCAARFPDNQFLAFALNVAAQRLSADQSHQS